MFTKFALDPLRSTELKRYLEGNRTFAMLSAARSGPRSQDIARTGSLRQDIINMGYSDAVIRRLRGQWEDQAGNMRAEPSYLVLGMSLQDAVELGRKYDQEAVIYKDATGTVGMYWLSGEPRVDMPSLDRNPLFGGDAVSMAPRKPKPERRGPPHPEDLWSKSRNMSFEVRYDWEDLVTVPWDGTSPVTADDVRGHVFGKQAGVGDALLRALPERWREWLLRELQLTDKSELGNLLASAISGGAFAAALGLGPEVVGTAAFTAALAAGQLSLPWLAKTLSEAREKRIMHDNLKETQQLLAGPEPGALSVTSPDDQGALSPADTGALSRTSQATPPSMPRSNQTWAFSARMSWRLDPHRHAPHDAEHVAESLEAMMNRPGSVMRLTATAVPAALPSIQLVDVEGEVVWQASWGLSPDRPAASSIQDWVEEQLERGAHMVTGLHTDFKRMRRLAQRKHDEPEYEVELEAPPELGMPEMTEPEGPAPAEREHGFAPLDLQPDGGYSNIMRTMDLATPEEVDYWANWYKHAHEEAKRLASDYGLDLETAAGVIAAISPGTRWETNIALAEQVIHEKDRLEQVMAQSWTRDVNEASIDARGNPTARKPGEPELMLKSPDKRPPHGTPIKHPVFLQKALNILNANDPLYGDKRGVAGPKVEIFYDSMVDPVGTSRNIVLDGHAVNLWRGDLESTLSNIKLNDSEREKMIADYQHVAEDFGLAPQEVQAITWSLWRAMRKHPPRPGTRMNLMGQLMAGSVDPDVVQLLADLNGISAEQVLEMMDADQATSLRTAQSQSVEVGHFQDLVTRYRMQMGKGAAVEGDEWLQQYEREWRDPRDLQEYLDEVNGLIDEYGPTFDLVRVRDALMRRVGQSQRNYIANKWTWAGRISWTVADTVMPGDPQIIANAFGRRVYHTKYARVVVEKTTPAPAANPRTRIFDIEGYWDGAIDASLSGQEAKDTIQQEVARILETEAGRLAGQTVAAPHADIKLRLRTAQATPPSGQYSADEEQVWKWTARASWNAQDRDWELRAVTGKLDSFEWEDRFGFPHISVEQVTEAPAQTAKIALLDIEGVWTGLVETGTKTADEVKKQMMDDVHRTLLLTIHGVKGGSRPSVKVQPVLRTAQARNPAIMAGASWLLTNLSAWQQLATAYPQLREVWAKFQAGSATMDDAVKAVEQLGPDVIRTYQGGAAPRRPTPTPGWERMAQATPPNGELNTWAWSGRVSWRVSQSDATSAKEAVKYLKYERVRDDLTTPGQPFDSTVITSAVAVPAAVRDLAIVKLEGTVTAEVFSGWSGERAREAALAVLSEDLAILLEEAGVDRGAWVDDIDKTKMTRIAARVRFEDEMAEQGELDIDAVRVGDRVRFDADVEKPGWPRVDAGTLGTITAVHPGMDLLEVEALATTAADNGEAETGVHTVGVEPDQVTVMVHSGEERLSNYRIGQRQPYKPYTDYAFKGTLYLDPDVLASCSDHVKDPGYLEHWMQKYSRAANTKVTATPFHGGMQIEVEGTLTPVHPDRGHGLEDQIREVIIAAFRTAVGEKGCRQQSGAPYRGSGLRIDWVKVASVTRTAAGVIDLHGLDETIADAFVEALGGQRLPMRQAELRKVAAAAMQDLGGETIGDIHGSDEPILRNDQADARLRDVRVMLVADAQRHNRQGRFLYDQQPPAIAVYLDNLFAERGADDPKEIRRTLVAVLGHELVHAADWAYHPSPRSWERKQFGPGSGFDVGVGGRVNPPTEQLAHARTVADELLAMHGDSAHNMSGAELYEAAASAGPMSKIVFEHMNPEYIPNLMRRVVKRLDNVRQGP